MRAAETKQWTACLEQQKGIFFSSGGSESEVKMLLAELVPSEAALLGLLDGGLPLSSSMRLSQFLLIRTPVMLVLVD